MTQRIQNNRTCWRFGFRELKPYSLDQIGEILDTNRQETYTIVDQLFSSGIMRYRVSLEAEDNVFVDDRVGESERIYVFSYVGMMLIGDRLIVVYPKYFLNREPNKEEIKQIFRVLRLNKKNLSVPISSSGITDQSDRLSLMLLLIDYYSEYGIYTNYVDALEKNGAGEIDWGVTINEQLPLLVNREPIYTDYVTHATQNNSKDFVARLHRAVLTEISEFFHCSGISDLLGLDELWLTDETVDDCGNTESLIWNLACESNVQFVTWKQEILRLLELYITNRRSSADVDTVQVLGTNSFYHIWEDACKVAFGDVLGSRTANRSAIKINDLNIPVATQWNDRANETLLDIIPCPSWIMLDDKYSTNVPTLKPDIVVLHVKDNEKNFCIYDAKYYTPVIQGDKIRRQPGVESVVKQFLYQNAYRQFVHDNGFKRVINAFLIPTENNMVQKLASVSFPGVMPYEDLPFSNKIDMWALPAVVIFDAYLQGNQIQLDEKFNADF